MDPEQPADALRPGLGRRRFLGLSGLGVVGVGLATACTRQDGAAPVHEGSTPDHPVTPPARDALRVLNPDQARTLDAMVARIIPGTAEEPGAREAAVIYYIDHLLESHSGHPSPAYMQGPFARTYEGDTPPADTDDNVVWIKADELSRYGRQSPFVPLQMYQMGLPRLDVLSEARFGSDFADASEDDQDALLEALEDAEDDDVTDVFDDLSADDFFDLVREHTLQGFLADPAYGGNRDLVGWRHIGFPGARRSFAPADFVDENYDVTPQSLLDLPSFSTDRGGHHAHGVPAVRRRHPNGPID
ncbi:MAG: gluconate 2-dehydrogenase subunit 3 family protein [Mobilicoccus sp.]|nr:gluconate 2-dehydrogenase subunit 3 family protein [Mobilicoccus sp.]